MSAAIPLQSGSPAGMGQLIKYFESQSQRLDRQSIAPQASCLNSDFESMIKFNGVPILPPAMTSGRREELRQAKKNAVLLEKRLKARQRRELMAVPDSAQIAFPETSPRPTARQLNFDAESVKGGDVPGRFGAMNPVSAFAAAETDLGTEDFGLQTMDSVNSDFMSMEQGSVPRVFAGLALTSFKEQKISYDLDRLSKVLNVQDMASTSGSDLSDALGNTQTLGEDDLQDAHRLAQKFLHSNNNNATTSGHMAGFFHESQDTVVEVSPEPGGGPKEDTASTSGFVDQATTSSNLEQTGTSLGSSPGCGSANTTDSSQRSNRSSPKSLKNAVHFASFLTEYNTSTSQLFERPMIVKKKMPHEQSVDHMASDIPPEGNVPIIGDPSEARQRNLQKQSGDSDGSNPLLNRVALNPDSDSSPVTPPFDPSAGIPFQSYGKSEHYSSDKENDASHSHRSSSQQGHRKSPDRPGKSTPSPKDQSQRWAVHRSTLERGTPSSVSPEAGSRGHRSDDSRRRSPAHGHNSHSLSLVGVSSGVGPQELTSRVDQVGVSQPATTLLLCEAEPASGPVVGLASGTGTVGQTSVSDSQGSNKSATLTGTSESSSSTIRDDLSAQENVNLSMNIIVAGHGSVDLAPAQPPTSLKEPAGEVCEESGNQEKTPPKRVIELSNSPIKLNTDCDSSAQPPSSGKDSETCPETPPRQFVRKGSYTLSEPSPALLKARAKQQELSDNQTNHVSDMECTSNQPVITADPPSDSTCDNAQPADANLPASDTGHRVQRKLPMVSLGVPQAHPQGNSSSRLSASPEAEREGKAEHINKYLNQVHFQSSMNLSCQSWDPAEQVSKQNSSHHSGDQTTEHSRGQIVQSSNIDESQGIESGEEGNSFAAHSSMMDVLKSLAESVQGSREQAPVSQLLTLHQQQMDCERQALITQQQRDMEELFVQQRRDMLLLEAEIKAAQQMEKDQTDFIVQNLPENIKVPARHHSDEYSPPQSGAFQPAQDPSGTGVESDGSHMTGLRPTGPGAMHSLDNRRPQSHTHRSAVGKLSHKEDVNLQPKSYPGVASTKLGHKTKKSLPYPVLKKSKVSPYSPRSAWEESQTYVKTLDDSFSPRNASPIVIPGFSPSASSPRIHRPLMLRSPLKSTALHRREARVVVPPEAHTPEMQEKFDKVTAVAKGFLTRCLLRSDKVQELVKTIKDTREFAFNFQSETPVKKGVFTPQDRTLLERIVAQLQAALLDIHEIFFEISCSERMALIEQTRAKEYDKRGRTSRDSLRGSGPRMSQATLKALERKRKAKEAEASVSASTSRPRTAPATSSPRCQNHTDIRALKPLQGHGQSQGHHKPDVSAVSKLETSRSDKERPRTAPAKQLTRPKRITALTAKHSNSPSNTSGDTSKDYLKEGSSKQNSTSAAKAVTKSKGASVKPVSSRPGKSWR